MERAEIDFQHRCGDFVSREVVYCVSSLVADVARLEPDEWHHLFYRPMDDDDFWDWARDAHVTLFEDGTYWSDETGINFSGPFDSEIAALRHAFDALDGDPADYESEVYEHWIVSDYLARKLEARGQVVEHDFHGLTVWGRCATGQAIALDGVICDIVREMEG
jgi:hypothetical protein